MPTTGKIQLNPGTKSNPTLGYRSTFRHENETASPGYYSVLLDEYQVKAELTTTERVGVHRYTYPKGEGNLILDLNHGIYNYDGKNVMVRNLCRIGYTCYGIQNDKWMG